MKIPTVQGVEIDTHKLPDVEAHIVELVRQLQVEASKYNIPIIACFFEPSKHSHLVHLMETISTGQWTPEEREEHFEILVYKLNMWLAWLTGGQLAIQKVDQKEI